MSWINSALERLLGGLNYWNDNIGAYLLIVLLLPVGVLFTITLGLPQIRRIGHAFGIITGKYSHSTDTGDISHFQALCAALSATVGTGNIAGVALAIAWGGPGAILWMWVTGFLGMATKAACCTLAVKYRDVHEDGSVSGGPMYYISKGLRSKYGSLAKAMAVLFATAGVICSMGSGNMAQSNSMAGALHANYGIPLWISGLVVAVLVFMVIVGGIKRIGAVASKLVPFMAGIYVLGALVVIFTNLEGVPGAFALIFNSAFSGTAATGGFAGSTFALAARWGIARGLFSNEAGQGSAPIAHAAARTNMPAKEGLVALAEPFVDTLVICTMTALVIILSGAWSSGLEGAPMTAHAFSLGLAPLNLEFLGGHIVALGLVLFALSTAISWSYYGDRCIEFLLGRRAIMPYRVVYCLFNFLGAIIPLALVWSFADFMICMMAVPNLVALVALAPEVKAQFKAYFDTRTVPAFPKAT